MPEYIFKHPKSNRTISIIQSINDEHVYVDEDGVKWDREWTIPTAGVDTVNDGSFKSFKNATSNKKGVTLGNMWDASREASERRVRSNGKDLIKESFFNDYSKKRLGKKHLEDR